MGEEAEFGDKPRLLAAEWTISYHWWARLQWGHFRMSETESPYRWLLIPEGKEVTPKDVLSKGEEGRPKQPRETNTEQGPRKGQRRAQDTHSLGQESHGHGLVGAKEYKYARRTW